MTSIIEFISQSFSYVGPFVLLLGLLIFVHELGHFLVAKFFGVRVEVFSLGFGKKIFQYKRGDTNYCISLVPLGGYVKMFGDDPSKEIPEEEKKFSFLHKPVLPRIAIVLAGPLMNLFFAMFLYSTISLLGELAPSPTIGDVAEDTVAYSAGFRSGDKIVAINAKPITTWTNIREFIEANVGTQLKFRVAREGTPQEFDVIAEAKLSPTDNPLSDHAMVGRIQGLTPEAEGAVVAIENLNTPAALSGVKNLDELVSIDGEPVRFYRNILKLLVAAKEKNKTQVTLQLRQVVEETPGNERSVTLSLERLNLESPDLKTIGFINASTTIARIKPGSPADKAGLIMGDRIVSVNQQEITAWEQVVTLVKGFNSDSADMDFSVLRGDQVLQVKVRPEMTSLMTETGKEESRYTIGIVSGTTRAVSEPILIKAGSLGEAFVLGITRSMETSRLIIKGLGKLIMGEISPRNVGGVITIGRFAGKSFQIGLASFLSMMALISINLFLINLLPVPVLDGGHLVFFTIEALRGAPLSMRKMEIAQQVGLVLLMSLMAFAFFNDINNLFNAW